MSERPTLPHMERPYDRPRPGAWPVAERATSLEPVPARPWWDPRARTVSRSA